MLEQKDPNLFTMSIGSLLPGNYRNHFFQYIKKIKDKSVTIVITYISELESEQGVTEFVLPTTVAPRYVPTKEELKLIKNTGVVASEEFRS